MKKILLLCLFAVLAFGIPALEINSKTQVNSLKVFATSGAYTGNLIRYAQDYGYIGSDGLEAGDYICQHLANNAGLNGEYKAWLSTNQVDAKNRFVEQNLPYYTIDGRLVAQNMSDLTTCYGGQCLFNGIDRDENNHIIWNYAWTGTRANGNKWLNLNCQDWTNDTFNNGYGKEGVYGNTGDYLSLWTESNYDYCFHEFHLYCFEDLTPDLVVSDIYYNYPYIKVQYCNVGTTWSPSDFLINLINLHNGKSYGGNPYYRFNVPSPGTCKVSGGYTPGLIGLRYGQYANISAEIDWEHRVAEINENNNVMVKTIGTTPIFN